MSKLSKFLAGERHGDEELWRLAEVQSEDYKAALGLDRNELREMERRGVVLTAQMPDGDEYKIVVKSVCTPFSDGQPSFGDNTPGWKRVLQPRVPIGCLGFRAEVGGGTSYFVVLQDDFHRQLIELLQQGQYELSKERIWP